MKSFQRLLSAGLLGVAAFTAGCPADPILPPEAEIDVTIDVNGSTGDAINDAYFGIGNLQNQPAIINEDANGDGNLDVFEDNDFDGNLDVAEDLNANGLLDPGEDIDGDGELDLENEDVDGDGLLDLSNEDFNDNGVLDTALPLDANQDGVIDANDNFTQTVFILVSSSGGVSCEDAVASLETGEDPLFSGTLLTTFGFQASLGSDIPNIFRAGQTITNIQGQTENIILQTTFGNFLDGVPINDSEAVGDLGVSLQIETLDGTLSANLFGNVVDNNDVEIPFSATYSEVPQCDALSAALQLRLESGNLF